ncbi:hypothetical protein BVRB_6g135190 [Beta vulgaris subsp. vulgaris]|nr:hypothetical protein BVRB_6g135190 [Beta vulgaris subsp. vulgaris]
MTISQSTIYFWIYYTHQYFTFYCICRLQVHKQVKLQNFYNRTGRKYDNTD